MGGSGVYTGGGAEAAHETSTEWYGLAVCSLEGRHRVPAEPRTCTSRSRVTRVSEYSMPARLLQPARIRT